MSRCVKRHPQLGVPTFPDYVYPEIHRRGESSFSIFDFSSDKTSYFPEYDNATEMQKTLLSRHNQKLVSTRNQLGIGCFREPLSLHRHIDSLIHSYTFSEIENVLSADDDFNDIWKSEESLVQNIQAANGEKLLGASAENRIFGNLYSQALYDNALMLKENMNADSSDSTVPTVYDDDHDTCPEPCIYDDQIDDLSIVPLELAASMVDMEAARQESREIWFEIARKISRMSFEEGEFVRVADLLDVQAGRVVGTQYTENRVDSRSAYILKCRDAAG